MNEIIEYPNYRVAADLAAAAVYNGPAIKVRGAKSASFYLTATNANIPAAVAIQVRKGAGTFQNVATVLGVTAIGTPAAALNAGGRVALVVGGDSALPAVTEIPSWDEARLTVTGHATLIITALAVTAQVVSDNAAARIVDTAGVTS